MKTIGFFCTGGYTETGGIDYFLRKINPDVNWQRCFPVINKPAPKKGITIPEPIDKDRGVTGEQLIKRMLSKMREKSFEQDITYDYFLVIDDLDCRSSDPNDIDIWVNRIKDSIAKEIGRDVDLFVLFASPEIEVWFWSDWANSFGSYYPKSIEVPLRIHLNAMLDKYYGCIEDCGGKLKDGSCENKLSEKIKESLYRIKQTGTIFSYSKKLDGSEILKRIDPKEVEKICRKYFAPVYRTLNSINEVTT